MRAIQNARHRKKTTILCPDQDGKDAIDGLIPEVTTLYGVDPSLIHTQIDRKKLRQKPRG